MNKLISFIMPVYNAEKSLDRSIGSIIGQKYSNIEIILVNDGSVDNSGEICRKYQEKDKRIKYIYQENSGVAVARNHGLKKATGDYVAFLDADDYIEDNFCDKMLECINKYNADICICRHYSTVQTVTADGTISEKTEKPSMSGRKSFCIKSSEYDFYSMHSHWTVWGVLFRREVLRGVRFRRGLFVGEDTLYFSETVKKSDKIAILNEPLLYYVIAPESASHGDFNEKKFTELKSWRRMVNLYSDRPRQQRIIKATYAKRCLKIIKTYYNNSEEFRKKYYPHTVSEYRKNAVCVFTTDIERKQYKNLIKHIIAYVMPSMATKGKI